MNANTIMANVQKIHVEAIEYLKGLMAAEIKNNPSITEITYKGEPNSYCDEGYACEGMVTVSTDEVDNSEADAWEYYDEDQPGIWSADSGQGFYNETTKQWQVHTEETMEPITAVAKRIFDEANAMSEVIGLNGYFSVTVTR